jgi:hypothetical protein
MTPGQLRRLAQELQIFDAQLMLGVGSEELQACVVPACLSMKIPPRDRSRHPVSASG